jgi:Mu-like prophage I protein
MSDPVSEKEKISISRQVSIILADRNSKPHEIKADASGTLPSEFELLTVGMWRTPYHGDIMIMPSDLDEYIENFKAGLGVSGNNMGKLPINYAHESWNKAAGWFVPAVRGDKLMATEVDWTPAAAQALLDGEWKCISAEFCPAGRGGWIDPLDEEHCVENVLTGAALTNIPLYSNLEPVMASASFSKNGEGKQEVFLITASKENTMPTLNEVVAKDVSALTEEDKKVLKENEASLTPEQKTKFGIEVPAAETPAPVAETPAPAPAPAEGEAPVAEAPAPTVTEDQEVAVAASLKSKGFAVVEASTLESLKETDKAYRTEKAQAKVDAHIARGAIKADQRDLWVAKIMADASNEDLLKGINDNPSLAAEIGSDAAAGSVDASAAAAEITKKAEAEVAASNGALDLGNAISKVRKANPDLAAIADGQPKESK